MMKHLVFLLLCLSVAHSTAVAGPDISHQGDILYRQASLKIRPDSVFYKENQDRNYVDQFYASLGIRRTVDYVNIVHVEPAFYTRRTNPDQLEFELDQAYFQAALSKKFSLLVGKKVEYRGSGYAINPSDVMNENKDVMDKVNQRKGQVMTRVDYLFAGGFSLGVGFLRSVNKDLDDARGWLLVTGNVLGGEMIFQGRFHHSEKSTLGLSYSRFVNDDIEFHLDGRWQARQRSSADFPERPFSSLDQTDASSSLVVGTRVAMPKRYTAIGEFYYNQSGLTGEELNSYFLDIVNKRLSGQTVPEPNTRPIGKTYAHIACHADELADSWRASLAGLMNLEDSSMYLSGELKYFVTSHIQLSYSPLLFLGGVGSEFGEMPTASAHFFAVQGQI